MLLNLLVPSLNCCTGLFSPACKTLDLPWWNSRGCCQPIHMACQGPTEGQPNPPVYKYNNFTWLSLGKWVMSKSTSGKLLEQQNEGEISVSWRSGEVKSWSLSFSTWPHSLSGCHGVPFSSFSFCLFVLSEFLTPYCNSLNSKLIFFALPASYRITDIKRWFYVCASPNSFFLYQWTQLNLSLKRVSLTSVCW